MSGGLRVCQKAKCLEELTLQGKVIDGVVREGQIAYGYEEVFDGGGVAGRKAFGLTVCFIRPGERLNLNGRVSFEFI